MWHYNIKGSKQARLFVHERIFIRQIEIRQIESRQIKIRQIVLRHEYDDLSKLSVKLLKDFSLRQIEMRQIEMTLHLKAARFIHALCE